MKGRSPQPTPSAIVFLRRSLVAATLAASLLSALIPFSAASSVHLCTMECCAGKAPHEAGACSSGLMKSVIVTEEPESLCGLHLNSVASYPTVTRQVPLEIIESANDMESSESCGDHAGSNAKVNLIQAKSPGSLSLAAPAMTKPCAADCAAAASAGFVRQPRPRAQTVAGTGLARPPANCYWLRSSFSQTATLRGHYKQPNPRGPPTSLS
jgi:hypothetical protein